MMESLPLEVLRMTLEHFSNAELLKISLVSKLFNYEARSLISTRANLNADLGTIACQNALPFVSHLKEMKVIPFSGIKIRWDSESHSKLCPLPQIILSPHTLEVLERVAWKRLSVSMHGRKYLPKICPALQLVQKMFKDCSAVLEKLELNDHPKLLQFIQEITQDRTFASLKILKIQGHSSQNDTREIQKIFIKETVARSPNLQEFHQDGPPDLSENLLEGSSSAVLVSNFECFNPALHEFSEGFTGTIKLKVIHLYYTAYFSVERFMRTVPRILQSSFDTLTSIYINLAFLAPLMGSGGACLKNVTFFAAYLDYAHWELTESSIFSLLKQFDFTRTFPKLKKVAVALAPFKDQISADHLTILANATILKELSPDRAMKIKQLTIVGPLTAQAIPFLAKMFPNVESLALGLCHGGRHVPYPFIWKHWLELKDFEVENLRPYTEGNENLDSDFCGIFPAEVALLREQDDEYLRAVHIVPVMPSITCLRALRTLRMVRRFNHCRCVYEEMDSKFSKVTALIAFQRCPNLSVNIQTSSQVMLEALNHLRPYAAVGLI